VAAPPLRPITPDEDIMATSPRKPAASATVDHASKIDRSRAPLTVSRPELLIGGSDREFRQLVHRLLSFLARHEKIRAGHARTIGLAGVEYTVLISIAHLSAEGDVSIKRVADHLHFSGAFITSTVGRLIELGLVLKKTDAADRRRVTLTLSGKGNTRLEKLAPVQRTINDVEFGGISREEFRLLLEIADRLIDGANKAVALQTYLMSHSDGKNNYHE
jgi:MarR family transcriptional regulator, organic hydroperoxide resistance regulator